MTPMRLVLWGDGESPHLLKWARALAPQLELWAASSRGFLPGFDALVPPERRLALGTRPERRRRQRRAVAQAAALCGLAAPGAARLDPRPLPHLARHAGLAGDHGARRAGPAGRLGLGLRRAGHAAAQRAAAQPHRPGAARLRAQHQRFAAHGAAHARAGRGRGDVLSLRPGDAAAVAGAQGRCAVLRQPRPGADLCAAARDRQYSPPSPRHWPQARLVVANDGLAARRAAGARGHAGPAGPGALRRPARCRRAGRALRPRALVPQPAAQRFGVGVGAGGDGARLRADPVGPAGQPRAGAQRRQRPDPGRRGDAVAGAAAAAAIARRRTSPAPTTPGSASTRCSAPASRPSWRACANCSAA